MFRKLRNNEEGAWEVFNMKYLEFFRKWARVCCSPGVDPEEVVQLIMLKIFETIQTFEYDRSKGRFRDYWKKAIKNLAGKLAQKEAGIQKRHEEAYRLLQDLEANRSLLAGLVKVEEMEQLQDAVQEIRMEMGEDSWMTWHLTEEMGLSRSEAASQLGITANNLGAKKTRFWQAVQKRLGKQVDDTQ